MLTYRENARRSGDPALQLTFAKYLLDTVGLAAANPILGTDGELEAEVIAEAQGLDGPDIIMDTRRKEMLIEAIYWIDRLARAGDGEGSLILGTWLEEGIMGKRKNERAAIRLYMVASKAGVGAGTWRAATMQERKGDISKAVNLYKKAAKQGNPQANYRMAKAYLKGELKVKPSERNALTCLRVATKNANSDCPDGAFLLAELLADWHPEWHIDQRWRSDEEALKALLRAGKFEYAPATRQLGRVFGQGLLGCTRDPAASVSWYRKAAEVGDGEAMLGLAIWCARGYPGVFDVDGRAAFEWCRRSVEEGYQPAEYVFGYMHEVGLGVKQEMTVAKAWYERAAKAGYEEARKRLKSGHVGQTPPSPLMLDGEVVLGVDGARVKSKAK
ncbi:hypothetical protein BJ684DRAFT_12391 [Piptocephalis cylindrospora]|uniref:HCP-like protein n=1 Tax=Piptocephalis cylindrospora TaxID=1907219 RepID=A0A4P9Y1W4_9FUNG|nr:hypothetical protein BJ684DRAFT_12391 [Piptocephalis cylindrospora]|eukprot:RKP11820.1 hypothetical protein BJ684DRAFT_12391 [Piptocephalis cylindrospora]